MTALVSTFIGLTGVVIAAPVVTLLGGVGVGGAVVYAGFRSFPPKIKTPAQLVGTQLSLAELHHLDPTPLRLAVIGASQSGKTTFLLNALHRPQTSTRTNSAYAEILMLPGDPPAYVALLDADGEQFVQQFEIAQMADLLIFIVDHSDIAFDPSMSAGRLTDHDKFFSQIESVLKKGMARPKAHLLFNKRDLWEGGTDAPALIKWFESHVDEWKKFGFVSDLSSGFHSNKRTDDMAVVIELIRKFASKRSTP